MAAHERAYLVIAHLQRRQDDLARRVIDESPRVAAVPQDIAPQVSLSHDSRAVLAPHRRMTISEVNGLHLTIMACEMALSDAVANWVRLRKFKVSEVDG
jgi:hypothetical protein